MGIWYTDPSNTNKVTVCPYCSNPIRKNIEITTYDTLEKVLYKAILSAGTNAFDNPQQLISFMLDLAPDMKKEIRILSKSLASECLKAVKTLFDSPLDSADVNISKLRYHLTEDEGLTDAWTDLICSTYVEALNYLHGVGIGEVLTAQIEEILLVQNPSEKKTQVTTLHPRSQKGAAKVSPIKKNNSERSSTNLPSPASCYEILEKGKNHMAQYISAFAHLQEAAEANEAEAQFELARCYYEGLGTSKDIVKANELLHAAANQGFVPAWHNLANNYFEQKNYKRAWKWYLRLADSGDSDGLYHIGLFYLHGYHVIQSKNTAIKNFEKAEIAGSSDASYQLGLIYNQEQKYVLAADAFEKAATLGHSEAMICLACAYQKGLGRNEDSFIAATWYQKAVDNGNLDAQKHLENCISQMSGTQKLKWTFSSK